MLARTEAAPLFFRAEVLVLMSWLWLLLIVPVVFSAGFAVGSVSAGAPAYDKGFAEGRRHAETQA